MCGHGGLVLNHLLDFGISPLSYRRIPVEEEKQSLEGEKIKTPHMKRI